MTQPANVVDFVLHRNRKQAQARGRLMWAMYAEQAAQASMQWLQPLAQHIESNRG